MRKKSKTAARASTRSSRVAMPEGYKFTYKDVDMLKNFISGQGMIMPRGKTGLSQKQQRQLAIEIKRARHLALLPFVQTM